MAGGLYDPDPPELSDDALEIIALALRMLDRTGDPDIDDAVEIIRNRLGESVPESEDLIGGRRDVPDDLEIQVTRQAVLEERKLFIEYLDGSNELTRRTIRPIEVRNGAHSHLIVAWFELRQAFRHFWAGSVQSYRLLDEYFKGEGDALRQRWRAENGIKDDDDSHAGRAIGNLRP